MRFLFQSNTETDSGSVNHDHSLEKHACQILFTDKVLLTIRGRGNVCGKKYCLIHNFTLLNVIIFIRPNSETAAGTICDALMLIVFSLLFDN